MSGLETLRAHACSAFVGAFWRPLPRFLLQACRERAQPGPCVGAGLRGSRIARAVASSGSRRVSIFAKRRCSLMSLRRPTLR